MADQQDLSPVDENWDTALAVVAHPDDLEFGAAAAIARWTAQGKNIVYCMVTSGEAGIDGMSPEECRKVRIAEQIASAKIVGVDDGPQLFFITLLVRYEYGCGGRRLAACCCPLAWVPSQNFPGDLRSTVRRGRRPAPSAAETRAERSGDPRRARVN